MQQHRTTERLAGQLPKERRSAWQSGPTTRVDGTGYARAFYRSIPLQMRTQLPWDRNKVQGLNVGMREISDMRVANFPESYVWRYVGTLERFARESYAEPVRTWDGLKPVETACDANEEIAQCEVELARLSGDRVRLARALDALMALDCETIGNAQERIRLCQREKAALFGEQR